MIRKNILFKMQAVILAGGKGTRLRPLTYKIPKPLLEINNKSILEINIEYLLKFGLKNLIIADGYFYGKMIENILGDGKKYNIKIQYSYEEKPLSTAGGLGLLKKKLKEDFLVLNADTLHNLDIKKLINFHKQKKSMFTISTYKIQHLIQLGILKNINDQLIDYIEKPKYTYDVSMGIYYLNKIIVDKFIASNVSIDFPTLAMKAIEYGIKVNLFFHEGLWMDLGTPKDYDNANRTVEKIKKDYPEIPLD